MKFHPPVHWWILLTAALAAAGIVALLRNVDPSQCRWMPRCAFHALTGLYCPGCGATRALHALVHGNVLASLRWNPLLVPLALMLGALLVRPQLGCRRSVTYPLLIVITLFWVLRNIPCYPLSLLAPGCL